MPGVGGVRVNVESIKERSFHNTVRQRYDFSCGSAALATLLTYHYGVPTSEQETFVSMYENGDQEKIMRMGFSMGDMKRYLAIKGFDANGFRVPLERINEIAVPAIVLLNYKGYSHFVVVKGLEKDKVLVGDPALGTRTMPRAEFENQWGGILFVILNQKTLGQQGFNRVSEWKLRPSSPLNTVQPVPMADLFLSLPRAGDF